MKKLIDNEKKEQELDRIKTETYFITDDVFSEFRYGLTDWYDCFQDNNGFEYYEILEVEQIDISENGIEFRIILVEDKEEQKEIEIESEADDE
jgi:hypothetical protein